MAPSNTRIIVIYKTIKITMYFIINSTDVLFFCYANTKEEINSAIPNTGSNKHRAIITCKKKKHGRLCNNY